MMSISIYWDFTNFLPGTATAKKIKYLNIFLSDTSSSITFALLTAQTTVRVQVMDSILSDRYLTRD